VRYQESLRSRLRPLAALINIPPFRVFEEMVDVRVRVAHHLVRQFIYAYMYGDECNGKID
jgi:hypothetical protein